MSNSEESDEREIVIRYIDPSTYWCDPISGEALKPRLMTLEEFEAIYPRVKND